MMSKRVRLALLIASLLLMAAASWGSTEALAITTISFADGTKDSAYMDLVQAVGGNGTYAWSVVSGSLPGGLTLNSNTGFISGTPTTAGSNTFTVQVTDADSSVATRQFSVSIDPRPLITTTSLQNGALGVFYDATVTASGGAPSITYSYIVSPTSALPPGLSITSQGRISGTPTVTGSFNFTAVVTDRWGAYAAQALSITVQAPSTTSLSSSANLSTYRGSVTFSAQVTQGATGTVTFKDGDAILGTTPLVGSTATYSTTDLSVGTHSITATYNGDSNYQSSLPAILAQTVTPASLTITAGNTTSISGSAPPAIAFTVNPNVTLDTSPICVSTVTSSTGVGTYNGANTCSAAMKANYAITYVAGDATVTWAAPTISATAGTGNTGTLVVKLSSPNGYSYLNWAVILVNSSFSYQDGCAVWYDRPSNKLSILNGSSWGDPVAVGTTGTLSSAQCSVDTGKSTIVRSGNDLTLYLAMTFTGGFIGDGKKVYGEVCDQAQHQDDGGYKLVATWGPATISKGNPSLTLAPSPNPAGLGQVVTFVSKLDSRATGTVTFTDNLIMLGTATVDDGTATYSTDELVAGTHAIMAIYSGDENWNASTFNISETVGLTKTQQQVISQRPWTTVPDEFVGPFKSWLNVKDPPSGTALTACVGNGKVDDTACLQAALYALSPSQPVLWIPAGNYNISKTLTVPNSFISGALTYPLVGLSIIGEDPKNTTIHWIGTNGDQMMLSAEAASWLKVSRLTWDGNNSAETGHVLGKVGSTEDVATYGNNIAETDEVFTNLQYGIRIVYSDTISIDRVKFEAITNAGITTETGNTLGIWVRDSVFENCHYGLDNSFGNFMVYSSIFRNSFSADMYANNSSYFSSRGNTSINSKAFFVTSPSGPNDAHITIQDNTIIDPVSSPFAIANMGPLMLIDNTILTSQGGPIAAFNDWISSDALTLGNTFTVTPDRILTGNVGRSMQIDDSYIDRSSFSLDSSLEAWQARNADGSYANEIDPPFLPQTTHSIYDVTVADLQSPTAFDNLPDGAVLHIPAGEHTLSTQLVIPGGTNIQLVGDGGYATFLKANPPAGTSMDSMIFLQNPAHVKLRDLALNGDNQNVEGIKVEVNDVPGSRVFISNTFPSEQNNSGLFADAIDQATMELHNSTIFGISSGIVVAGGVSGQAGKPTFGGVRSFGGMDFSSTGCTYTVQDGGTLAIKDSWHEGNATCYINLSTMTGHSNQGNVTFQGGQLADPGGNPFSISSFSGDVSLIGFQMDWEKRYGNPLPPHIYVDNSDQGNLRFLAFGVGGIENQFFSPDPATLDLSANNIGLVMSDFWADPNNTASGWQSIADAGRDDKGFIRSMFSQARRTEALSPYDLTSNLTDARLERVYIDQATTAIHLVHCTPTTKNCDTSASAQTYGITASSARYTFVRVDYGTFSLTTVDASNSPVALGSDLQLHNVNVADSTQVWIIDPIGNGYYTIRNIGTGGYLSRGGDVEQLLPAPAADGTSQWLIEP
jgi:hypothetical protein